MEKLFTTHNQGARILCVKLKLLDREVLIQCQFSPGLSLFQGNLRKPGKESFSEGQKLGCYFSVTKSCPTLCNSMYCSMPVFPVPHHLPEFAQMQVHWIDDGIKASGPLPSPSPLVRNFPRIRVFSNELAPSIRWPKYWSFSFSISPSSEYSEFISFRIDWFELFADQGTHENFLQHSNSKASILWHSVFCMVQLSHLYVITGH